MECVGCVQHNDVPRSAFKMKSKKDTFAHNLGHIVVVDWCYILLSGQAYSTAKSSVSCGASYTFHAFFQSQVLRETTSITILADYSN